MMATILAWYAALTDTVGVVFAWVLLLYLGALALVVVSLTVASVQEVIRRIRVRRYMAQVHAEAYRERHRRGWDDAA